MTSSPPDARDSNDAAGNAVLAEAVRAYRRALGERLVAAYALGSLAHGGFSPLVSDIDIGLVLADPLEPADAATIARIVDALRAGGSELHERLSVFWGTPSTLRGNGEGGRFPPLDRLDLLEHGRLLDGDDVRTGLPRPSRQDVLITGAEFALGFLAGTPPASHASEAKLASMATAGSEAVDELRTPALLLARGVRHVTKVVLFPVRFVFAAATGSVGTNHGAVEHYLALDTAPGLELVTAALAWRTSPPADEDATALLGEHLLPLYRFYIDDHVARLATAGAPELARAFAAWRARLD